MTQDWKEEFDKKFASMYLIADERIIELNHKLLKGFISGLLKEQRNAVLSEVEREVVKRLYCGTCGSSIEYCKRCSDGDKAIDFEDISTIINNLRIKQ